MCYHVYQGGGGTISSGFQTCMYYILTHPSKSIRDQSEAPAPTWHRGVGRAPARKNPRTNVTPPGLTVASYRSLNKDAGCSSKAVVAVDHGDWTESFLSSLHKLERALQRTTLLFHMLPLYFRPHASSPPPNFLQFTADQNLLIKKDIFGAAHFPMTCQPFWASCHLSSQQCGWDLIPGKLWEPRARVARDSGRESLGVHLEKHALAAKHKCSSLCRRRGHLIAGPAVIANWLIQLIQLITLNEYTFNLFYLLSDVSIKLAGSRPW